MHYALLGRAIDTLFVDVVRVVTQNVVGFPLVSQATPLRLKGIICVACETVLG